MKCKKTPLLDDYGLNTEIEGIDQREDGDYVKYGVILSPKK